MSDCHAITIDNLPSPPDFEALLQREVERAVWALEAARADPRTAEVCIVKIRRILQAMQDVSLKCDYPLVAALCASACRLIDADRPHGSQQRGLREHLQALRNIVIAGLQDRRYDGLAA
jgi:hypothetical protein